VSWKLQPEEDRHGTLHLTVRDTGIGIPPEERERVFDSFVQLDPTHTKTRRGLGLGLAVVKRACNLVGGTISISDNTTDGEGTEITVRIPLELVPQPAHNPPDEPVPPVPFDPPVPPAPAAQPERKEPDSTQTVLIVEDEAINRMYLSSWLKRTGYATREYDSGIPLLDEQPFPDVDVILMDIGLPHISGLDVARKIRDRGISIPIIAVTAYSSQNDVDTYRDAHMNGFVPKPITESVLSRVLRDTLAGNGWTV
jgi:two-component system, sensor histidine kinase